MENKGKKSTKMSEIKFFLTRNAIKAGIFALVALLLVGGNFFLEGRVLAQDSDKSAYEFVMRPEIALPGGATFRFADGESYGFDNDMKLVSAEDGYVFELESGKFWGNFSASSEKANIIVGEVVVIPDRAAFDLEFNGEKLELRVFEGDVYLGFLDGGVYVTKFADQYSDQFMNRLLVPRGTGISVAMSQIDSQWKKLLFSKLVKEVKHGFVTEESDWVKDNLRQDEKELQILKDEMFSDINARGASFDGGVAEGLFWLEKNLTFFPEKKKQRVFGHLFDSLDNAIYYAVNGDEPKSAESLDKFKGDLALLDVDLRKSDEFYQRLDGYVDDLMIFGPEDDGYEVLSFLLERKILDGRDRYAVVGSFWQDVYSSLDLGEDFEVFAAFDNYYNYYERVLGGDLDQEFYAKYITYQNQLLDNLFLKSALFYSDKYFGIKHAGLEQQLLGLYEAGELKEELKQAFVNQKIRFLKRLRTFLFAETLDVDEANKVAKRLFREINDLMPEGSSGVAVVEFFEKQIADMADFFDYLDSSEYNSSRIYGATHKERYEFYLKEKPFISNFEKIRNSVLGDEPEVKVSKSKVLADIAADIDEFSDVTDYNLGEISDANQRYVDITMAIGGYSVSAVYDREKVGVKDVYVYGELVSDRLVKLGSLLGLLHERFADRDILDDEPEKDVLETAAERTARIFVAKKLNDAGFKADESNVKVVDNLNVIYRVEGIYAEGNKTTLLTFDFLMNGEVAKNLFMNIKGDPVVVEGEFTLEQLLLLATGEVDVFAGQESGVRR